MSAAKHTPGPLKVVRFLEHDGTPVHLVSTFAGCPLARLQDCADDPGNALLFAAATDLLEALVDVLRIAKAASIGVSGNAKRIARAEAAIAKANGDIT